MPHSPAPREVIILQGIDGRYSFCARLTLSEAQIMGTDWAPLPWSPVSSEAEALALLPRVRSDLAARAARYSAVVAP